MPNYGALFKRDKQGNEKRPDYSGEIEVAGVKYYLAAWLKKSVKGEVFMSLEATKVDKKVEAGDDIPF